MNHALADLTAQEADLLPTRLTLGTFGRPIDGFFHRPDVDVTNVNATNFAIAARGPAVALQNINVR